MLEAFIILGLLKIGKSIFEVGMESDAQKIRDSQSRYSEPVSKKPLTWEELRENERRNMSKHGNFRNLM